MMKLNYIPLILALSSTGALAAPSYDLSPASNSTAQTASTAGATNAGNTQSINSYAPASESIKTNPSIVGPGLYGSFSVDSCTTSAGGGGSVLGFGMTVGGPVKDAECNSRRNATLLMQVSNNIRPFDRAKADRLTQAAINVLCRADDDLYATLDSAGLCDRIDYAARKKEDRVSTGTVPRGQALAYFPGK